MTYILAKYAEYTNVGGNKTGGFGVTKFVPRGGKQKKEYV